MLRFPTHPLHGDTGGQPRTGDDLHAMWQWLSVHARQRFRMPAEDSKTFSTGLKPGGMAGKDFDEERLGCDETKPAGKLPAELRPGRRTETVNRTQAPADLGLKPACHLRIDQYS